MYRAMFFAALVVSSGLYADESSDPLTIQYYDVQGSTAKEILDVLDKNGPLDVQNHHYHGMTRWTIETAHTYQYDAQHCTLNTFSATLKVTMILPRWQPPPEASARLVAQWQRYSTALRTHENGHYEVAKDAREEILSRVKAIQPEPDCRLLAKQIGDIVQAVTDAHRQLDEAYDAKTNHGQTQGARFP